MCTQAPSISRRAGLFSGTPNLSPIKYRTSLYETRFCIQLRFRSAASHAGNGTRSSLHGSKSGAGVPIRVGDPWDQFRLIILD
jgi:hypothetical protein